jgi:IS1 family transposase/transposase-like protein
MQIEITLKCPSCEGINIVKNGKKSYQVQNYQCKDCQRQFIGDHALRYKGCHSDLYHKIELMLVRNVGIRDIAEIEHVSLGTVLSVLTESNKVITPKQKHYDVLEVDEFWSYVGDKQTKVWLIYAYHRKTGEIVSWVFGKRDYKTAKKLRDKITEQGFTFDTIATDNWDSFLKAFSSDNHIVGKIYTKGIEGNNCRLRHRIRRAVRKTCCFSKKMLNHIKAFSLAFFYINYGYV